MRKRLVFLAAFLLFACLWVSALGAESNLIPNGGFEDVDELLDPVDWYATSYRNEQGYSRLFITDRIAHSGRYSASVENASLNDARFVCTVSVEPNTCYRLSGYVYVDNMGDEGNGANFAVEDIYAFSVGLYDTGHAWKYLEWYGRTGSSQREITLGVRVGGYGAESVGKAYFDDISLEKVDEPPEDAIPAVWYSINSGAANASEQTSESGAITKNTHWFVLLAMLYILLCYLLRPLLSKEKSKYALLAFGLLTVAALVIRLILGVRVAGYQVDISCFTAWSLRMADVGPAGFYAPDYFCDYPPGYMLLLWPCGLLLKGLGAFSAQAGSAALLIVKCVPILCDLLGGAALFRYGQKKLGSVPAALVASLYLFNPAALVNGAAWGQADSVLALCLLLCCVAAMERKWHWALPIYVLAILLKPQALLLAPVACVWLVDSFLNKRDERGRQLSRLWKGLGASVAVALLIVVPFSIRQERPLGWLVTLYTDTLSSYAFATLNTANLYYLLAANWTPIAAKTGWALPACTAVLSLLPMATLLWKGKKGARFSLAEHPSRLALLCGAFAVYQAALAVFGGTYSLYGYGMMALIYGFVILCLWNDPAADRLPFYLALALIGIYLFGIKVHERYLFPALILLLACYIRTRDFRMLILFIGFSVTTFVNTAIVLDNSILLGSAMGHLNDDTLAINVLLGASNLLLTGLAVWTALRPSLPARAEQSAAAPKQAFLVPPCYEEMLLSPRDDRLRLTLRDYLVMGVVSVLYAVLAFTNLGSTVAPQDGWVSSSGEETVVFELPENEPFFFQYYAGISYNSFSISVSDDGQTWSENYPCVMKEGLCYVWQYALQSYIGPDGQVVYRENAPTGKLLLKGKYLRLNAEAAGLNLFEVACKDLDGNRIPLTVTAHTGANPDILSESKPPENLLNEQDTVAEPGCYTGMYFDEIYHARTAYEHLHGQKPYETTHPPLGKLIMAVGIAIFGMTPFGWRFSGTLIGVLMLPALYLLAKQLFKRRDIAAFSMIAFALDLMHYAQTRIATIDSFPVFFIILSYLCMARYMQFDVFALGEGESARLFSRAFWRSLIPLGLSGLFMGLSIASKWIGLYSAVGLAVLYFSAVYRQFRTGNYAFAYFGKTQKSFTANQRKRVDAAQEYALKRVFVTCCFCLLFFIAVPALIYYLSYIPYLSPTGPVTIKRVIQAQQGMLAYHSTPGLGMDHPFQSPWWQWPFILKPIWFFQDKFEPEGLQSTIMCMGNPWVFYIGAFCMAGVVIAFALKHVAVKEGGLALRRGDGEMSLYFLVIGFAAQYLPWVLVPRSMYIYHYFASVPFIILATAWFVNRIPVEKKKQRLAVISVYLLGAAAFFVMFFPYASGWYTSQEWLDAMKWFSALYY